MADIILLDVDNTILDFGACAKKSIEEAAVTFGINLPMDFMKIFDRINEGLWKRVEKGELTPEELYSIRFNLIFKETGITYDGVTFEHEFYKNLSVSHEPVSGAMEILSYLHSRYKVFIASNADLSQQEKRLTLAGFMPYLDGIFASEEIGYPKPKKEFFDEILKRMNARRADCLMIGDSLTSDIKGALDNGISAIWYNPKKKENPYPEVPSVSKLTEIMNLI